MTSAFAAATTSGTVERHREANPIEQVAHRQIVPIGCKAAANERGASCRPSSAAP